MVDYYVRRGGTLICPNGVRRLTTTHGLTRGTLHDRSRTCTPPCTWALFTGGATRQRNAACPRFQRGPTPRVALICSTGGCSRPRSSARYLSAANLRPGDEFIPLILAGTEDVHEPVAAVYKLRSDLKGNIIIQTLALTRPRATKRFRRSAWRGLSSSRLPTDWTACSGIICGLSRRIRRTGSRYYGIVHKDFSPKPPFHAYETLARMLPKALHAPQLRTDAVQVPRNMGMLQNAA